MNIGIGKSYLGPEMAYRALRAFSNRSMIFHFTANDDAADFSEATQDLDAAVSKHFAAASTNIKGATEFGIDTAAIFGFWDRVGGRHSMDNAIGLSTMIAVGPDNFHAILAGFRAMDEHFRTAPAAHNLPLLLGLLAVWYNNFFDAQTVGIMPYAANLARFSAYLQQLQMESNGKHVELDGHMMDYQTSPIIWGEPGTDGQHSFYQLLHQGTKLVPCDRDRLLPADEPTCRAARPVDGQSPRASRGAGLRHDGGRVEGRRLARFPDAFPRH